MYILEVASARRKGLFGNCNQLFITFGVFASYIFGTKFGSVQIPFHIVSLVAAGILTLFEVLMLFTQETPRWLFGKNKDYQGIKVLKLLRGPDAQIMQEIDRIKAVLRKSYTVLEQFKEFRHRSVYHPFILVLVLMFFQQFSGINAAIFYTSNIFSDAGFSSDKVDLVSAMSVGVTQIISTFLSVLLVDRLGRRVLLLFSSIGMCGSSVVLAVFFYLHDSNPHCNTSVAATATAAPSHYCSNIGSMAVASVVVFIASFSFGWGPITWTSMSELLPNRVRGLAASISTMVNWSFATIVTLFFTKYADLVTEKFAWGTFAIIMFLSCIFVVLFLPETKGRSLEEIQEDFEKGQIFAIRIKCIGRRAGSRNPSQASIN